MLPVGGFSFSPEAIILHDHNGYDNWQITVLRSEITAINHPLKTSEWRLIVQILFHRPLWSLSFLSPLRSVHDGLDEVEKPCFLWVDVFALLWCYQANDGREHCTSRSCLFFWIRQENREFLMVREEAVPTLRSGSEKSETDVSKKRTHHVFICNSCLRFLLF